MAGNTSREIHLRFLSQLEVGTVCRDAAEVPYCSHQESERTLKGDADEVDAGLCVLLRCKAADPDEPTSGLDPVSRDELLQILSEYIEDGEHSVLFSTHITGDLERAADYITYISYGELFFSGSKDEFVDMFRIVKGGTEELSADLKEKAVGVRTFPTGFEALVKTEDTGAFSPLSIEPATIDEIVVFTSKKGDDYE